MSEIKKVLYKGEIAITDKIKINCAVLDDGTRILVQRNLANSLGARGSAAYYKEKKQKKGALLPEYVSAKYLQPYIDENTKNNLIKSTIYIDTNGKQTSGVSAEYLIEICDIWHKARQNGALDDKPNALAAANNAHIIFKGFAKVGIIALVDEATGYQYKRDKDDLQVILSAYITDEVAKWQLTFTEDFYDQIFRLWKQSYNKQKQKRPVFFGTLTNKYIYEPMKDGVVLCEIKQKVNENDKKARFHQYLTQDIGREHLKRQIIEVTALMSICNTKEEFTEIFNKKYLKDYQQSLFAEPPQDKVKYKGEQTPRELDNFVSKVMSHKIDPNAPLPNNSFKKS